MRVALIGPPCSGKSTLFAAVAEAGGSHVDLSRPDQAHLAVVKVPDDRLTWLAEQYAPKKVTPAELTFVDLPGFDLADEAGRNRARTHWQEMRNSDMLVLVVRDFEDASVPAYRGRVDADGDIAELLAEMLFADLEQVTTRIERLEAALRKPTAQRDEQKRELALMKRLVEALEAEQRIGTVQTTEAESKLLRSFAFLSEKPALVLLNHGEDDLGEGPPGRREGLECLMLSAKIEEEIAQLPADQRAEFLADLGVAESARDRLIHACYQQLRLASFLTISENECRAWTIPAGTDAVTAAEEIHTDIARGFIRAETVSHEELKSAGSMKAARAAGKVRLEGKGYVVQDGDVINFRFNV